MKIKIIIPLFVIIIILIIRVMYMDYKNEMAAANASQALIEYNVTEGMRPLVVTVRGEYATSISNFRAYTEEGKIVNCLATKSCHFEIDCDGDGVFEVRSSAFGQTRQGAEYSVSFYKTEADVHCKATGIPHHIAIRGNISEVKLKVVSVSSLDKEYISVVSARSLDKEYISLDQWGDIAWSCINIFSDCDKSCDCKPDKSVQGIVYNASDNPNLKYVKSLSYWAKPYACFVGSIENWDVSNVKSMSYAFEGSSRTQVFKPLGDRTNDERSLIHLSQPMAYQPSKNMRRSPRDKRKMCNVFNQPLNSWDVSHVWNMESMFSGASSFNQPLDSWDVSNVTDMSSMFSGASSFNQPLDSWDVSHVKDMSNMFAGALAFNQPLNPWDVSNVTDMNRMFSGASSFNQPLNSWDISHVESMSYMFSRASSFNQSLDSWSVTERTNTWRMFYRKNMFDKYPDWYDKGFDFN